MSLRTIKSQFMNLIPEIAFNDPELVCVILSVKSRRSLFLWPDGTILVCLPKTPCESARRSYLTFFSFLSNNRALPPLHFLTFTFVYLYCKTSLFLFLILWFSIRLSVSFEIFCHLSVFVFLLRHPFFMSFYCLVVSFRAQVIFCRRLGKTERPKVRVSVSLKL